MITFTTSTGRHRPRGAAGEQGGVAMLLHEALARTRQHRTRQHRTRQHRAE